MLAMGVDPGLSGALALLGPDGVLFTSPLPVLTNAQGKREIAARELNALFGMLIIKYQRIHLTVLEQVHAFPDDARVSLATFMKGVGKIKACLEINNLSVEEVPPPTWKKVVLAGTKRDKAAAIGWVKARFPGIDLTCGGFYRKDSDGIAEAVCLAEYGRRMILGVKSPLPEPNGIQGSSGSNT